MTAKQGVEADIEFHGNKFTNICTVGVLKPKVSKALGLEDVVMIIAIDSKKQKHLRVNLPTQTLAQHRDRCSVDIPSVEEEAPGVWWLTRYEDPGGDGGRIIKVCVATPDGKAPLDERRPVVGC